jgi:hypothetical protein
MSFDMARDAPKTIPPFHVKWVLAGSVVFGIGLLFKLAHWHMAGLLIILSIPLIGVGAFTHFQRHDRLMAWSFVAHLSLTLAGAYVVFRIQHWTWAFELFWIALPVHIGAAVLWFFQKRPFIRAFIPQLGLMAFTILLSYTPSHRIHEVINLSSPFHTRERLFAYSEWYKQAWFLQLAGRDAEALIALDSSSIKFQRALDVGQAEDHGQQVAIDSARTMIGEKRWHSFTYLDGLP